jgi:hypothetical protein
MAFSAKDFVLLAAASAPGTGTVTVNSSPVSGWLNMVSGDNGNTFNITIYDCDGNGNPNGLVEVQKTSTWDNTAKTFTRSSGNVVAGSSGAGVLVNFTGGAQRVAVSVFTSADHLATVFGASALTNHGILLGQGTATLTATAAMTDGQLLVGQTTANPLPKTLGGDATLAATGALSLANDLTLGGKPKINAHYGDITSDTDGATVTFDLSVTDKHTVTLGGSRTLAISNGTNGQVFMIILVQDSGGSKTVTWFSTIKWAGGSAPTLTTTANKADVFSFIQTTSGNYYGFVVGQNL